jgi:hypothetical protein
VVTGQNIQYKNLQRLEIDAFAWVEKANLALLTSMLQGNDFASSRPSRFYIPKANSTTHPITLLTIQDSILYQAFGNIIGRKVRPILSTLYNKATFSNQLNEPSSIYFVKPWKNSYKSYLDAEKDAFTQGLPGLPSLTLPHFMT